MGVQVSKCCKATMMHDNKWCPCCDRPSLPKEMKNTGRKDNHGNRIYYGDIVQTYCYNEYKQHEVYEKDGIAYAGGYKLNSIYFVGGGDSFKVITN